MSVESEEKEEEQREKEEEQREEEHEEDQRERERQNEQAVTRVAKKLEDRVCPSCHQPTYYLCETCGHCNKCCNCSSNTKRSDTEPG